MNEAIGIVRESEGATATVDVDAAACPRCLAGQGCGAGLFSGRGGTLSIRVPVRAGLRVSEGDRVHLSLAGRSLVRGALIAYGLPLAGLLLGTIAAGFVAAGDLVTVGAALVGLSFGFAIGRVIVRRDPCISALCPTADAAAAPAAEDLRRRMSP